MTKKYRAGHFSVLNIFVFESNLPTMLGKLLVKLKGQDQWPYLLPPIFYQQP